MTTRAWVVRIASREAYCFNNNTVAIGWSDAKDLNRPNLTWDAFKAIVKAAYPVQYTNPDALGQAAGSIWRFVRDIKPDDWVIAPTWTGLNVARVTGQLVYDSSQVPDDNAWRYPVKWIRLDIPRDTASAPLQARCSSRQTCVEATEFLVEIEQLSLQVGKPQSCARPRPQWSKLCNRRRTRPSLDAGRFGTPSHAIGFKGWRPGGPASEESR